MSALPNRIQFKIRVTEAGCWEWTGCIRKDGYGSVRMGDRTMLTHRAVYELCIGPIPEGLTLDHLCRNRPCCNPAHLEPVTGTENIQRGIAGDFNGTKTHCPQGHEYTETNTGRSRIGRDYIVRYCRTCKREKQYSRTHK